MASIKTENELIAERFFATLSAGDYLNLQPMFREDAVWTVMPTSIPGSGDHCGAAVITQDFKTIRELFKDGDPKLRVTNAFSKGPWVAVETHTVGAFKNGNTYDSRYCWVMEIVDGKIKTLREYMDGGYVAKQI
jgi:ketosteroid isomerase-like protein